MRIFIFFLFIVVQCSLVAQTHQFGFEMSPNWNLNTHRSKLNTGWNSESGYGFTSGFVFNRFNEDESTFTHAGLLYQFTSFENRANNTLVDAFRYQSVQIPFSYNMAVLTGWWVSVGVGANYLFNATYQLYGQKINNKSAVKTLQPFFSVGTTGFRSLGGLDSELGVNFRYHFLEFWQDNQPSVPSYTTKLLSIDFVIRFYLKKS